MVPGSAPGALPPTPCPHGRPVEVAAGRALPACGLSRTISLNPHSTSVTPLSAPRERGLARQTRPRSVAPEAREASLLERPRVHSPSLNDRRPPCSARRFGADSVCCLSARELGRVREDLHLPSLASRCCCVRRSAPEPGFLSETEDTNTNSVMLEWQRSLSQKECHHCNLLETIFFF